MNPITRHQSQTPGESPVPNADAGVPRRIPAELRFWAAERLVAAPHRREAARRLVESASRHGIDLDLMWGVVDPDPPGDRPRVRQACLAVMGSGRTAMLFFSNPENESRLGPRENQVAEITASIRAALAGLGDLSPQRVTLAQTLIEPAHQWARHASTDAGMICVGQLDYMRRPLTGDDRAPRPEPQWPPGVEVRPLTTLDPHARDSDYHHLIAALEGSYTDTLDCPELCGLRAMPDVVESHRATGRFEPGRWLLIFKDGQPAGCCLLTHCPPSQSVELVYLGIAPRARGLGLGRGVLEHAIHRLGPIDAREVTCAVDSRNLPAIKIYESLRFHRFDARVGFVAPVKPRG